VSFIGEIKKVPEGEETTKAREMYLAKHPGHFWVDFGTFTSSYLFILITTFIHLFSYLVIYLFSYLYIYLFKNK